MPFWDDENQEQPMSFRDMTTFDGQDCDDERDRDREMEFLSDHEVVAEVMARRSGGTSGHEAEHRPPQREDGAGGTSNWETEQEGESHDTSDSKTRRRCGPNARPVE